MCLKRSPHRAADRCPVPDQKRKSALLGSFVAIGPKRSPQIIPGFVPESLALKEKAPELPRP